jgi:hypothetical protein
MGKYEPLKRFLVSQDRDYVPMTFEAIERVLGERLPASKGNRAWWSNNPSNNVMTREWLDAGYRTEAVDIAGEKLVFRRVRDAPTAGFAEEAIRFTGENDEGRDAGSRRRHPIFGCMKGTLTLRPDVDLTEPADPEWGKVYD